MPIVLDFGPCDLPFDLFDLEAPDRLAQGSGVLSPSTLLRTVSLSIGLSNHLLFVV
jgi:hypothetical protein